MREWSIEQKNFFEVVLDKEKKRPNVCLAATAGSGKTTTLLESLKLVPKFSRPIFLSFSNAIVNELKSKVPEGIPANTLHSLGFSFLRNSYRDLQLDEDKYFVKALTKFFPDYSSRTKDSYRDCYRIQDITKYVRMTLIDINPVSIIEMCNYYNIDYTLEVVEQAIKLLSEEEKFLKKIDFTDMIYLPATLPGVITRQYDHVFLDEAQDLNNCQKLFIEKILTPNGRLIAVGDSKQSIFSFAGSNINSFELLQQRPNTVTLPLSTSYRCAKNIVKAANRLCDSIKAYEHNIEGIVRNGDITEIEEGDLVICRTVRPLVSLFFELLDRRVKSRIVGKDIEQGLVKLAERCKSYTKIGYIENFMNELYAVEQELRVLGVRKISEHPRYAALDEKISILKFILERTEIPSELSREVSQLFEPSRKEVRLMTLHKSKGLENERVFMIMNYKGQKLLPFHYAQQAHEMIQETNLEFVGITRAKNELVYITLE